MVNQRYWLYWSVHIFLVWFHTKLLFVFSMVRTKSKKKNMFNLHKIRLICIMHNILTISTAIITFWITTHFWDEVTGTLILAVGSKTSFLDINKGSLSGILDSTLSLISLQIKTRLGKNCKYQNTTKLTTRHNTQYV